MLTKLNHTQHSGAPGAYVITHQLSGKAYVGSTRNLYGRKAFHEWALKLGRHSNTQLQKAYIQDPSLAFEFYPTVDRESALALEKQLIARHRALSGVFNDYVYLKPPRLKSTTPGPHVIDEVTRAKMDATRRVRAQKVNIMGIRYNCIHDASIALRINKHTLESRVRSSSPQFKDWFFCD